MSLEQITSLSLNGGSIDKKKQHQKLIEIQNLPTRIGMEEEEEGRRRTGSDPHQSGTTHCNLRAISVKETGAFETAIIIIIIIANWQ